MDIRLPNNWRPRHYQRASWLAWELGCRREVLIWHRRAGKDDVQLHKACRAAHIRVGNYWHMLPSYEQCRKAIWEAVNPATQKRRIDEAFPKALRARTDNSGMVIEFTNGSVWRLVGSDDPSSLVGAPPIGICFSEFALSNPETWAYLAPILAENGGWASFITTSRGRNHAWDMLQLARRDPWSEQNPDGWFSEVLTPAETGFPVELVEKQRREYHGIYGEDAGDALIEQEYWCSFEAAVLGSYYGKLIAQAERAGRIGHYPWLPDLPVHCAWDIGLGPNMAIWFFQATFEGPRIIGALAGAHDEVIVDLVAKLKSDYPYKWGDDWVPHDIKVKEHFGKTRVELLISLGRKPRLVPDHHVDDGINAARVLLPRCVFDETGCEPGLKAMRDYRAEWDADRRDFKDKPYHNWSSHFADGYRYLAVAWRELKAPEPPKPPGRTIHQMTLNEAWEMLKENRNENRI